MFGVPDERLGETVAAVLVVQRAGGDGVPGAPLQSMVGTLNGAAREVRWSTTASMCCVHLPVRGCGRNACAACYMVAGSDGALPA